MAGIWTMGEMIVEIMREKVNSPLHSADTFLGPYASGAPAIFIDTVAKLGGECGIIGGVGDDDFGRCIVDKLKADGADCSYVSSDPNNSTGCAFVTYFEDGSRKFIFHIGNTPAAAAKSPEKLPENVGFFHIMGCSVTASAAFGREIVTTMERLAAAGAKVSFDPNIRPELMKDEACKKLIDTVLEHTNVFMPGKSELLMMVTDTQVEDAVKSLFARYPKMELIVLKDGSNGSAVYTREGAVYKCGIYKVEAKDSTGAGDSFDGAFLWGILSGKSIEESMKQASAAAALNTAAFGPMEGKISPEAVAKMIS